MFGIFEGSLTYEGFGQPTARAAAGGGGAAVTITLHLQIIDQLINEELTVLVMS